ncbi:MAG: ATP-binding protein [Bacteroidales bacterium]
MLKNNIISAIILALIIAVNVLAVFTLKSRYTNYFYENLQDQVNRCGENMETTLLQFTSDINQELKGYADLFQDADRFGEASRSLQMFYIKYRDLITNISVFDNQRNYFGIYLDSDESFGKSDRFVVDSFPMKTQRDLYSRHRIEQKGSVLRYYYPYFGADEVSGNMMVEVNLDRFSRQIFELYPIGRLLKYQWMLDAEGVVVTGNFPSDSVEILGLNELTDSIKAESFGLIRHELKTQEGEVETLLTAYYPLSIYSRKMGVLFSGSRSEFARFFLRNQMRVAMMSLLLGLGLTFYLLFALARIQRRERKLKLSEIVYRQILEYFPVGIMIIDQKNIIRDVNEAAQKMLFVGNAENLVGQDFSKQFIISNRYLLNDSLSPFMDGSHYLYYEKDGIETVIFRSEKTANIGGEELKLIALIDVSPLEKSRKGEVAANKAKSDFLAAMSHEIRTPMNGILGMVNQLLENPGQKDIKSKIEVIKRSADLLMTIINDILDFSKIEAGRMMLEEIPFNLSDELNLVGELFRPLAEEKGLDISINLHKDVPQKLIGDPFRLRQVISNLVSNAVKFSDKGSIVISATLMESFKSQVNLLFSVEDSGIGIPRDRIKEIFGSYTQARGSVTRKFGGTGLGTAIARQLVELMHGEIWVESPSGIGTPENPGSKFSFTIEAYSNERISKKFDFSGLTSFKDIQVLILTKESDETKNTMSRLLTKFGLQVRTTVYQDSTVDSVVHHIQVKKEKYHMLVLVDKNQLDGFALAQELQNRELSDHFLILLVSSNDRTGNYKTCRKLGIDNYLIEPFETKEVYDILGENFPGITDHKQLEPMVNALPETLSILLAEDNLINQKVAQSIFKNIGYEINIAKNGKEAVDLVEEGSYDVVFMDLLMPEMDGSQQRSASE